MSFLGLLLVWLTVAQAMQLRSASLHHETTLQHSTVGSTAQISYINGSKFEIDGNLLVDIPGNLDWVNVAEVAHQPVAADSNTLVGWGYYFDFGSVGQQLAYTYFIRSKSDSTTFNALEFNQVYSADPANPIRTTGDVLLIFSQPIVTFKTWESGSPSAWGLTWSLATWLATTSTNTQTVPAASTGGVFSSAYSTDLLAATFQEAAFNFQSLPCFLANQCFRYFGMTFKLVNTITGAVSQTTTPYQISISTCGKIIVYKSDTATGNPLAGATFVLYSYNNGAPGIAITPTLSCTTDATGSCIIDGITITGPYFVKEATPPAGYSSSSSYQPVSVVVGQLSSANFTDTILPNVKSLALKIQKADPSMQPLTGATFTIQGPNGPPITFAGVPAIFCTDAYPGGLWTIDNTTNFCGNFSVSETIAPNGYSLGPSLIPGLANYVRNRTLTICYNVNRLSTACTNRAVDLVFQDSPLPARILIAKKQATVGGLGLAGVTFGLCTDNQGKTCTAQQVTDVNGNAEFDVTDFTKTYYIVELKAPAGWLLAAAQGPFTLVNGRTIPLTFLDAQLLISGGPKISKVSNTGSALAGATFQVIGPNNVSTIFTNVTNGTFCSDNYPNQLASWPLNSVTGCGTFIVTELIPPPGYQLSQPATQTITLCVAPDSTTRLSCSQRTPDVTFTDSPATPPSTGAIQVTKNGAYYIGLPGAVFQIQQVGSSLTWTLTTDSTGTACQAGLSLSQSYTVTEITPPTGYALDSTPQTLQLSSSSSCTNSPVVVKFTDGLVTSGVIRVYKVWRCGALPNAIFSLTSSNGYSQNLTTDKNGYACVDNLILGSAYTLTEIVPPQGYSLAAPQIVTVSEQGTCATATSYITIFDPILTGAVQIHNVGAYQQNLAGSLFSIVGGNVNLNGTTDATGALCFDTLEWGQTYQITILSTATGYNFPTVTLQSITIQQASNCSNTPYQLNFQSPLKGLFRRRV